MDTIKDEIKNGIDFEEDIFNVIAQQLIHTSAYEVLIQDKKDKIISILKTLSKDTAKHKEILQKIIEKY